MKKFLEKNIVIIATIIMLMVMLGNCSQNRHIALIKNDIAAIKDSSYTKEELDGKLDEIALKIDFSTKIEGLKSEKRMIQSTDRKLWDLERQKNIDKELDKLYKEFYEALD